MSRARKPAWPNRRRPLRLPVLRRRLSEMGGAMRCLRRLEHARRGGGAREAAPKGLAGRARAQARTSSRSPARPRRSRAGPPASPNSTASAAAAWCRARRCSSAAIPASANPPCCFRRCGARSQRRGGQRDLYLRRGVAGAGAPARRAHRAFRARRCSSAAATIVRDIVATLESRRARPTSSPSIPSRPCISTTLDSAPGTVAQVRASAHDLIRLAKARGFTLLLVGHVTKDGQIAGPRVSSTWSTPCSISRASAAISSASCARSRTASARPTRSACSR